MKFHPQCEGITLEDESDFEDLTPIVDYICKVSLIICEFKHSVLMNILKWKCFVLFKSDIFEVKSLSTYVHIYRRRQEGFRFQNFLQ